MRAVHSLESTFQSFQRIVVRRCLKAKVVLEVTIATGHKPRLKQEIKKEKNQIKRPNTDL